MRLRLDPLVKRQAPLATHRAPHGVDAGESETDDYWRRVLAGELSDAEAWELDDYLARLTPASDPSPADAGDGDGDDGRAARLRQTLAEGIVESLVPPEEAQVPALSFADQRRLVRDAICFPDATLFELLSRLASEAEPGSDGDPPGRLCSAGDPPGRRCVELALLAIDSLEANGLLETDPGTAALAWARLARARWRAGDPVAAEQDLERAAAAGEGEVGELWMAQEAERRRVEVAFHWLRGRRFCGGIRGVGCVGSWPVLSSVKMEWCPTFRGRAARGDVFELPWVQELIDTG